MRAKWANINKDHTTEERALSLSLSPLSLSLSLSPSLPLSNLCIVLLVFDISDKTTNFPVMSVRKEYSLDELAHLRRRARNPHSVLLFSSRTSAIKALILNV